nr:hypothetical protein [Desulfobulbaceae bacterium]
MKKNSSRFCSLILLFSLLAVPEALLAGNKKIMSTRAAQVAAERGLVEAVYGLKIRASESVEDMIAASFEGKTETKTEAQITGIKIEEVTYDAEKDIAKATASVSLDSLTNIDGQEMNLGGRVFRRIGFATSTKSQAGPLKALRAAEVDAYKQLAKRIVGFTLESKTTVENFMLTSDIIKTKVMATMYLADIIDYGWDEQGDAYVKMQLNTNEIAGILGQGVVGQEELVIVEGLGAQEDDYSKGNQ